MDPDDLDDFIDGNRAALEARFRELEREAELQRLRDGTDAPQSREPSARKGPRTPPGSAPVDDNPQSTRVPPGDDPLSEMKAALDTPPEVYLLVLCPGCGAKNRLSLSKVRTLTPVCGRCKRELAS